MNISVIRKKPIEVEAIQFNNLNYEEIEKFVGKKLRKEIESETAYVAGKGAPVLSITIPTKEGDMKAFPSDWIIKGVEGEFYPCKDSILRKSYDFVTQTEPNETKTTI